MEKRVQTKRKTSTPQTGKLCYNARININFLMLVYMQNSKRALSVIPI